MWVHSCGCWFRVGGGACIRGSVLASTATKVVDLGSGLGSLWGFFVMCACVFLCDVCLCCFACVVLLVLFLLCCLLVLFCPGAPTLFCLSKIK